jgi:hypothetical protein
MTESLQNFVDCLHLGIPKFLTKFDKVSLLQAFCHLEPNKNAMNTCFTTLLSGRQTHLLVLRGSKKLRVHMKVPSNTMLSFCTREEKMQMDTSHSATIFFILLSLWLWYSYD